MMGRFIPISVHSLFILLFVGLCGLREVSSGATHTCIHDFVRNVRDIGGSEQIYNGTFPSASNTSPIRIIYDTSLLQANADAGYTCYAAGDTIQATNNLGELVDPYTCTDADVLSSALSDYVTKTLLPTAKGILSSAFYVMPVVGPVYLGDSSGQCGAQIPITIPDDYTRDGSGVADADLVVFVTSRPIPTSAVSNSKTLAFGVHCLEDQYGRPVCGQLNFNPSGLALDTFDYQTQLLTAVHETTHVLGYSIDKFQAINLPDGSVGDATLNTSLNCGVKGEAVAKLMIGTPAVLKWVRDYFNCDTLLGAELEDGGAAGTKLSHWEKRVFMNEYMTGSSTHNPVFSGLTLAFFEDSGWYTVNYDAADQLEWGRGLGCGFATGPCSSWPAASPVGYWCTSSSQTGCTFDLQGKGECGISNSASVPPEYQYLPSGEQGPSLLADYCPYTVTVSNGWCTDPSQNSETLLNYGEVYGATSRCFQSSLVKNLPVSPLTTQRCYEVACLSATEVRISIDSLWYDCPSGITTSISGYGGTVQCPSVGLLCSGAATDPNWPRITKIDPASGGPGTVITITGTGFTNGTTVTIHDPCVSVTVQSWTTIIATIPNTDWFNSPSRVVNEQVDVIVANSVGHSIVDPDAFTVAVKLSISRVSLWVKDNILPVLAMALAIIIAILVCAYCCLKNKKQEKLRELDILQSQAAEEAYYHK